MRNRDILIESTSLGIVIAVALILLLNFTARKEQLSKAGLHSVEITTKSDFPSPGTQTKKISAYNPGASIPSAVFIEAGRQVLCLFTIDFEVDVQFLEHKPDAPLPLTKFFFTLFRTFISPNAP
jgi:hypothetical protein